MSLRYMSKGEYKIKCLLLQDSIDGRKYSLKITETFFLIEKSQDFFVITVNFKKPLVKMRQAMDTA